MANREVTPWELLDIETNAKFRFRQNDSSGKLLDTYTIRFESDNTSKNGKSLGTVHKNFFDETKATLFILWELIDNEDVFTNKATSIFQKRRRFTEKRIPLALESKIDEMINEFLEGDDF